MGQRFWRFFSGIFIIFQFAWIEPIAQANPIQELAQATQALALRAEGVRSGDPISDLIQAVITIANVLNATAPEVQKFMTAADQFFPQAENFVGDFHEMLSYGDSWNSFSKSFSKVADVITQYAPETMPKLNSALDSITSISQIIEQNSNPFFQGFNGATSTISTMAHPGFIISVVAGSIAIAWCLKYEDLGKYVFTLDPTRSVFYRGAATCGRCLTSAWSWVTGGSRVACTPPTQDLELVDLEAGLAAHERL